MIIQQLVELIQKHAPDLGETEALILLNQAQIEFIERTNYLRSTKSFTTTANVRNYTLPTDVKEITDVYINNHEIKQLMGYPKTEDDSSGSM